MKLCYFITFLILKKIYSFLIDISATKQVKSYCDNGLYIIDMKVKFYSLFKEYYSFILNVENPYLIKFKCFISYENKNIFCTANLNSNKINIERTEIIKLPHEFPKINGVIFEYDTFVKYIYEKQLILEYSCKQKNLDNILEYKLPNDEWGFIFNITSISNNKCTIAKNVEENKYDFNMKINILDGLLKDRFEKLNELNDNQNIEIEFLQDIWVPLEIGDNTSNFTKNNDFDFGFCYIKEKISKTNIKKLINEGFYLECNIPIQEEQLMLGIIKIEPFFDQIIIKINSDSSEKSEIMAVNCYFNINRTIEEKNIVINSDISTGTNESKILEKSNLRRNDEISENITELIANNETKNISINSIINAETETVTEIKNDKELNLTSDENIIDKSKEIGNEKKFYKTINYFLLGDEINKIYCPDKPVFTIDKPINIQLKSAQRKKYIISLLGKLSFKYQLENNNSNYNELNKTKEEINFNLQVIDNLAENEDNKKSLLICLIPNNTEYLNKRIFIYCKGDKISEESMKKTDADITLNWGIDVNRQHENIIIRWPKVKRKIKNLYSYTLNAFSLSQKNYGCFNNDFYFYIYIHSLNYEPDLAFEINMRNPKKLKAQCKIYDSSLLKCAFPLHKERILKGTNISLPINVSYEINDSMGNTILFVVDDYRYDYDDFHLIVKETCGDYAIIGALKKAGMSGYMIFIWFYSITSFILIVFICFVCYVKYKIKYRNRKGKYYAYNDEGDSSNAKAKVLNSSVKEKKLKL